MKKSNTILLLIFFFTIIVFNIGTYFNYEQRKNEQKIYVQKSNKFFELLDNYSNTCKLKLSDDDNKEYDKELKKLKKELIWYFNKNINFLNNYSRKKINTMFKNFNNCEDYRDINKVKEIKMIVNKALNENKSLVKKEEGKLNAILFISLFSLFMILTLLKVKFV